MTMTVEIGIDEKVVKRHADLLNQLLANEFVLYIKTLNFHWNVKGKWFGPLHIFFENHYEQLLAMIDIIAEQVKMLGFDAVGSLQEFTALKSVSEGPIQVQQDTEMLQILLSLHSAVMNQIRFMLEEISKSNNYALENVLQDILAKHEKMHWMLRAHLE